MNIMETKRLDQEIERHRHITSTTSCYPSEIKVRMSNAALDFTLNNELNHIAKQMKHFKVSYEREHIRSFKRRNSSLVRVAVASSGSPPTMSSPLHFPKPPSLAAEKGNNNTSNTNSNNNINVINVKITESASVPSLPDLNNVNISSSPLPSSKSRRISYSTSVSSLQSFQDPKGLQDSKNQDSKNVLNPKSLQKERGLFRTSTRSLSLIPSTSDRFNRNLQSFQQFRRSSMFANPSLSTSPKNPKTSFGSYSSTNLTSKPG